MNLEVALEQVGDGWSDLVRSYYGFVDVIDTYVDLVKVSDYYDADKVNPGVPSVDVTVVEVSRGMLNIVAVHPESRVQEMLNKLAWALERDSAKFCEVCGEKGYRRKSLEGSPNRCQPHYIELLNRLADEGKI